MKKILALVLTLAMMLTMFNLGFVASAAEYEIPAGATKITDAAGLAAMEEGKYYYLANDITLGTPQIREEQTSIGTQADVVTPGVEAELITIPAGATLDGCGYTIYHGFYESNPGWYTTSNKYVNSMSWSHSLFEISAGDQITIKNLNIGSEEIPVYMSKSNSVGANGDLTANDIWGIFDDTEGSNVVWNNVNFYAERYGRGLGDFNTAVVMFKSLGNHNFTDCSVHTSTLSAGSQAGAWIYRPDKGSISMTNCSLEGFVISAGTDPETGDEVFLTPTISGSYTGGFFNYVYVDTTMVNCVNNVNISASYSGTAGHWSGLVNNFQKGALYMENCVNNGDITIKGLTIGGAICGRTGGASAITSFRLINCVNNGNIHRNTAVAGVSSNHGYGAITGHTASDSVYEVRGCVNYGNMTGATACVGGIIGFAEGAATKVIENCVNYGNLSGATNTEAGGIIGQLRLNGAISGCKNFGAVNLPNYNGGIVGRAYSAASNYSFTNCANYGTIGNNSTKYAAGILSYSCYNDCNVTIENSVNYGKILSNQYAGGFVAENRNPLVINNSANFGEVAGVHAVGGFVGQSSNQTTTTATLTNCLNAGYIHEGPAAGEGIGGFFGRVAGTKAVIELNNCANIGTINGSTKANNVYGYFGDTVGQFIGVYTVSAVAYNYADNNRVGGFMDWSADGAVKPTLTNCSAFGNVVLADGALSLSGWITADETGTKYDANSKYYHDGTLAEIPNNGVYGINVEINPNSTVDTTADAAELSDLATALNVNFTTGDAGEIVIADPALRGYQFSLDGTAIRFVSALNTENYDSVGFTYSVKFNGAYIIEETTTTVDYILTNINAVTGDDSKTISAEDLFAKYLSVITFTGIPAEGTLVITVTPMAGEFTGNTTTLTITNGQVA